jgi:hypothetical protein
MIPARKNDGEFRIVDVITCVCSGFGISAMLTRIATTITSGIVRMFVATMSTIPPMITPLNEILRMNTPDLGTLAPMLE